jgi:uncharacterized protein (UPF0305 family)
MFGTASWVGSLGSVTFLLGKCAPSARRICAQEEIVKNYTKDLNVSIAHLRAMLKGSVTEPQQREAVEKVIGRLRQLRRDPSPTKAEFYRCVREVCEALLRTFGR